MDRDGDTCEVEIRMRKVIAAHARLKKEGVLYSCVFTLHTQCAFNPV